MQVQPINIFHWFKFVKNLNTIAEQILLFSETLRKYPPLPFLDRRCDFDHRIEETGLVIEKGTAIYIPVSGIQNDEKYFPEPELYNPDRFEDAVNGNLLSYFPFGYGPRACIGKTQNKFLF